MSKTKIHYSVRLRIDQLRYLKTIQNPSKWIREAIDEKRKHEKHEDDSLKKFIFHAVPVNMSGPAHSHESLEIYIGPAWIDFVEINKRLGIRMLKSIELKEGEAVIIKENVPHQGKIFEGGMIYTTEKNLKKADVRNSLEDFL